MEKEELVEKILKITDEQSMQIDPPPGSWKNGYKTGFMDGLFLVLDLIKTMDRT